MSGRTLHVVSHSHWDREWYMPFELHRRRLVRLLDDLLETLDRDPDFGSFHLDGQSIPLEDYLQVRPAAAERLRRAGEAGRITLGPWYVLQDEFLTSAEAQVRNMLYGMRTAAAFGPVLKVGYLADAFGHIGQMPAILAGFGIDNAVFGRGVNRREPLGDSDAPDEERGYPSEFTWRGSDGTEILAIYMANWYANAMDIPAEPAACVARFEAIRDACLRYATTPHLLLMNGCDHTPCQLHISQLIATARAALDDEIVHSRLDDYVAAVRAAAGELPVAAGELRSRFTDGWSTLTNVLSARLYLKQANQRCQTLLERRLEPLQAVLAQLGTAPDRDFRTYLWKLLLQNHPHDSICGCSVDPVHREMETRFAKVHELAGQLARESLEAIAARVDTSRAADIEVPLVIYNPLGFDRRELVVTTVDFPDGTELGSVRVRDAAGRDVKAAVVEDLGRVWTYDLPDDRFRVPYHVRHMRVAFIAQVPAFGYATYTAAPQPKAEAPRRRPGGVLENRLLRVTVGLHGVLDILDKETGREWSGLNVLHFGRDLGDEYNYRPPEPDQTRLAGESVRDEVPVWDDDWETEDDVEDGDEELEGGAGSEGYGEVMDHGPLQSYQGLTFFELPPESLDGDDFDLDDLLDDDSEWQEISIFFRLLLPRDSKRLLVDLRFPLVDAENYRVRALFPTGVKTETVSADGHFEVVTRPLEPWHGWRNPSDCQPCLDFVDLSDGEGGLTIAPRGLPEYEVLLDGENTIALTLIRGVERLGDWGIFPTPDAQCKRQMEATYEIIPHAGPLAGSGDVAARAGNAPLTVAQTGRHGGELPPTCSWLRLEPAWLALSAVRWAEDRDAFVVRFYNPYERPVSAKLSSGLGFSSAWRCNLNEERGAALPWGPDGLELALGPKEIVTVELA